MLCTRKLFKNEKSQAGKFLREPFVAPKMVAGGFLFLIAGLFYGATGHRLASPYIS
jgi:hypothetical protein